MNQKTAPRCSGKPFSIKAQLVDGFLKGNPTKLTSKKNEGNTYRFRPGLSHLDSSCGIDDLVWDLDFKRFPVSKNRTIRFSGTFHPYPIGRVTSRESGPMILPSPTPGGYQL